ncbi:malto-oligosyltrehalose trehalohydrolase [Novispirillum sp. DQ9]|uniref:malto-oligosyltrehalose trehalohydrolase n=1 Tax=Novispirillum sp. DQ9 TaxID=3398612 RepID=UPI003C7E0A81
MSRYHRMPFGAETGFQGTRFALWAPEAEGVELLLETPEDATDGSPVPGKVTAMTMDATGSGWYSCMVNDAAEGTLYRFRPHGPLNPEGLAVPDPASRFQPFGVHAASEVIDPDRYSWDDASWVGRPWEETVLYELHVGTFTPEGTYLGVMERLDHLARLGVTAIELMPVAAGPGRWGWGYDGVTLFAPFAPYGRPEELKQLVDAAHQRDLMVFMDVVYNHFGPEGNYLHLYAKSFFDESRHTPWGAAINFDRDNSRTVRDFFIHNALYWLEEFHIDGLRLDAVHAIADSGSPHILEELAEAVHRGPAVNRHVHLVLENDANQTRFLKRGEAGQPLFHVAQWNDDIHHCFHTLLTGEDQGYYADYATDAGALLARCLSEGFAWQGEPSRHRGGARRGEPSADLPPTAFVSFIQNHDQIGNRAFGERLSDLIGGRAVEAAQSLLLLSPQVPLLFMGEEWGAENPFLYFTDVGPELADAVRDGRRGEFKSFPEFASPEARARIPDPLAESTVARSRLKWDDLTQARHARRLDTVRDLLGLRRREITPRLAGMTNEGSVAAWDDGTKVLTARWTLADGAVLSVVSTLGPDDREGLGRPPGRVLHESCPGDWTEDGGRLAGWTTVWYLADGPA